MTIRIRTLGRPALRRATAIGGLVALCAVAAACGADDAAGDAERPQIVVTTPMLGSVVRDLVGDRAQVTVLMPNGADPHDYQPSARAAADLTGADLVVENGADLETGLGDLLDTVRADGVPVFTAAENVALIEFRGHQHDDDHAGDEHDDDHPGDEHATDGHAGDDHDHDDEHAGDDHPGEDGSGSASAVPADGDEHPQEDHGHAHGAEDPHIWMDALRMRDVAEALVPVIERELGFDTAAEADVLADRLEEVHGQILTELKPIAEDDRVMVTGHESMGYFAQAHDFRVVGTVIPALTSQAEPSAAQLADLREVVQREGVPVVFNELGTPDGVAEAVAEQTGAQVVELTTHTLPEDGSYVTFIRGAAETVRNAYLGD